MAKPLISITSEGLAEAQEAMLILMLPAKTKRRFVARMARMVIAQAVRNVKDQKNVDGSPFYPRQHYLDYLSTLKHRPDAVMPKGENAPMLTKMVRTKWMGVRVVSDDESNVFFPYRKIKVRRKWDPPIVNQGQLANKHQRGGRALGLMRTFLRYPSAFDTSKVQTRLNKYGYTTETGNPGCTANQAAELLRLEYLPPWLRGMDAAAVGAAARLRNVMTNVSRAQASFLIHEGRKKRCGVSKAPDNTPARPFLGASSDLRRSWGEALWRDIYSSFRAKKYQGLLQ